MVEGAHMGEEGEGITGGIMVGPKTNRNLSKALPLQIRLDSLFNLIDRTFINLKSCPYPTQRIDSVMGLNHTAILENADWALNSVRTVRSSR